MTPFDQLNPALQHHIVNSLGWTTLRPTQLDAIEPVLQGRNVLLLAPTAGGKTEAAIFPVLSRMLTERWDGLSVLYISPLRALANNLEPRLQHYAGLIGRTVGVWHGDIKQGSKRSVLRHPPDMLLTTPESVEAMLISRQIEHRVLFSRLRTVIVDELHAFAGDDRGWHLLAVIERLERIARRRLQRIGLSATVGNPDSLLEWLSRGDGGSVVGQSGAPPGGAVTLDHVGSLENAAIVLSRLHRGEKRLVFCDSRAKVERLASGLRERGVRTFVSHSSLGIDERRIAEEAFATGDDCVIVATSTLELGIDVGDLDRVIQIDSPPAVSSFLQRMGRTGRRSGSVRNCLFLTTNESAFLQAAGIILLWSEGWVEPVVPPADPLHLFAQQIMALTLQERGLPRNGWREWVGRVFPEVDDGRAEYVLSYMVDTGILAADGGILGIGRRGEEVVGRRNFMELVAAFTTPLLLSVRHGQTEIGQVDPTSLETRDEQTASLLLAGRSWKVVAVDWPRRAVTVEPSTEPGRSRWSGGSRTLRFELCQAMERVLVSTGSSVPVSKRGQECLDSLRNNFAFADGQSLPLVPDGRGRMRWWTFAGARANAMLAEGLTQAGCECRGHDDMSVVTLALEKSAAVAAIHSISVDRQSCQADEHLLKDMKFSACLPIETARAILTKRLSDPDGLTRIRERPIRVVTVADEISSAISQT